MVTADDARWLADHLRKMVSSRPAAWASSEMTLTQLAQFGRRHGCARSRLGVLAGCAAIATIHWRVSKEPLLGNA